MTGKWVEPDIRDEVIDFVSFIVPLTDLSKKDMMSLIGINQSKCYSWAARVGKENYHNHICPKR